jgi:hypothetical protein
VFGGRVGNWNTPDLVVFEKVNVVMVSVTWAKVAMEEQTNKMMEIESAFMEEFWNPNLMRHSVSAPSLRRNRKVPIPNRNG